MSDSDNAIQQQKAELHRTVFMVAGGAVIMDIGMLIHDADHREFRPISWLDRGAAYQRPSRPLSEIPEGVEIPEYETPVELQVVLGTIEEHVDLYRQQLTQAAENMLEHCSPEKTAATVKHAEKLGYKHQQGAVLIPVDRKAPPGSNNSRWCGFTMEKEKP